MKAAYADPPYLGCAEKHYGKMHDRAADYDDPLTHKRLIERLADEYESWGLSMNEPSLRILLPWCPSDCHTGVWVKSFASFKPNVGHAWTWEPVVFRFARKRTRQQPTWRDHIVCPITLKKGFTGAKPQPFCFWVFDGLNLLDGDGFDDIFPGSGAVGEAYDLWRQSGQFRAVPTGGSVSATPRTDSFIAKWCEYSPDVDRFSELATFARQLERELASVERLYEKKTAERDGEEHQRP